MKNKGESKISGYRCCPVVGPTGPTGAKGETGPRGPIGFPGICGKPGLGAGIETFGYIYDFATVNDAIVPGGATISFSNNGYLKGIAHVAGTTNIKVTKSGIYKIDYSINVTAGEFAAIALAINGIIDSSTNINILVQTGNITGQAIISLNAGDIITLVNNSLVPITLSLFPNIGVQLTIIQLG